MGYKGDTFDIVAWHGKYAFTGSTWWDRIIKRYDIVSNIQTFTRGLIQLKLILD